MPGTTNVKDLVVPIAMVGALLGQMFYLGRASQRLDLAVDSVSALATANGERAKSEIEIRAQIKFLESSLEREERELRLLRDYTEGRISRLPYRPNGGM